MRRTLFRSVLCLTLGIPFLTVPSRGASDGEILEKVLRALNQRKQVLHHYSVVATTQLRGQQRPGAQQRPNETRHYFGSSDEFKAEPLGGGRGQGRRFGRGGRGSGGRGLGGFQIFQRGDLLSQIDPQQLLKGAKIKGNDGDGVQIQVKTKLDQVNLKDGLLTVNAETGSPLSFQTKFSATRGFAEGKLLILYSWDSEKNISVAREQEVEVELGGGFGGGGRGERRGTGGFAGGGQPIRLALSWRNYEWDLQFEEDFFQVAEQPRPARAPAAAANRDNANREPAPGQPATQGATVEDPFEEIRIQPRGAERTESLQAANQREEVFIEGGSIEQRRGGGGFGESRLMSALMRGGGGRGAGGGGLRGARIAGSRANGLQGTLTTTLSGSPFDARPYALDGQETKQLGALTWQLGASVGGPLGSTQNSPNQGSRGGGRRGGGGRASFFVDFSTNQGNRLQSQFGTVPTSLERNGDFSKTFFRSGPLAGNPIQIVDPADGQAFPGAVIPGQMLNPTAQQILEFVPLPNREDSFLNYFQQSKLQNQSYRINVRLNVPLYESLRLNSTYNINLSDRDQFSLFPDLAGNSDGRGQRLSLRFNHRLGERFSHNPTLNWNRNRNRNLNPFAFGTNLASDLGFENTSTAPIDFGLPTIEFTNFSTISDGSSRLTINESNGFSDSFSLIWRRHFFRIGGDLNWRRRNQFGNPSGAGTLTFAGTATSEYRNGAPRANSGYDLADFLLGLAQSSRIQYGNSDHYLRRREFSLYLNDNWRVLSKLTIQWGLRYQYTPPWSESQDRIANLDIAPGFADVETVVPGQVGKYFGAYPDTLVQSDRNNLAPRIGLAYRLRSGTYSSVLRSSYGVFFPDEAYNYFVNEFTSQPPFGFTVQESVQNPPFLAMETAFGDEFSAEVANTYAVDPNFRLPTVQNWDLSWQQALPKGFFISVGYAGSRGVGLEQLRAPNRTAAGEDLIANAAEFLYLTAGAGSTFHGLQILATRRMRAGFSVSGQYEFGRAIDNASAIAGGNRVVAQDDSDLSAERSRSSFDERHKLNLNWFFELPFGNRRRWLREGGLAGVLFRDWYLNGTLRATSGTPFTARLQGNRISNSGTASQASERASASGLPVNLDGSESSTVRWFNTAAFTIPQAGEFGNAGRNTIDGPGSWTINLNLARAFTVGREGQRLLLMLRSNNVLNHPNYRGLNTTVNSTGFGQVTSVGGMRSLQLNIRYIF